MFGPAHMKGKESGWLAMTTMTATITTTTTRTTTAKNTRTQTRPDTGPNHCSVTQSYAQRPARAARGQQTSWISWDTLSVSIHQ